MSLKDHHGLQLKIIHILMWHVLERPVLSLYKMLKGPFPQRNWWKLLLKQQLNSREIDLIHEPNVEIIFQKNL